MTVAPPPAGAAEQPNPLGRTVEFNFDNREIDAAVEEKLRNDGRGLNLRGFRPGKAPLSVLKRRFGGAYLHDELINRAATMFNEAQTKEGAELAAASPEMTAKTMAQPYAVECRYEAIPKILPPDFAGKKFARPALNIGDAEVERMIEKLRRDAGHYLPVKRRAALGDMVTVDHALLVDGEERESGENRHWLLGGGLLGSDVQNALLGAGEGDAREIVIELAQPPAGAEPAEGESEDGAEEGEKGEKVGAEKAENEQRKKGVLRILVKAVNELQKAELNDALFKIYGVSEGGLEAFRENVRELLRLEAKQKLRALLSQRALDCFLIATPKFDLPRAMLRDEIITLWSARREELLRAGLAPAAGKLLPEHFAAAASRRVALGLLLSQWKLREGKEITDADAEERMNEMSGAYESPDAFKAHVRASPHEWETIKLALLEERAIEWVCEQTQAQEEQVPFELLLGA